MSWLYCLLTIIHLHLNIMYSILKIDMLLSNVFAIVNEINLELRHRLNYEFLFFR